MRTDIKHKKYRMIHKQVEDMYCNEFLNITQCCKELAITPSTYQRICKELNVNSVGYDRKRQKQLEEEKENEANQKGGSKSKKEPKKEPKKEAKKSTRKVSSSKKKGKSTDTPDLTELDNEDSDSE